MNIIKEEIPKVIHYCWIGGNTKPESVIKCIESWKQYCPDYEIKEWNENNLNIESNVYSKQAYEEKAWGFVTDYFRLWIIYNYGGIYLDTDVQIIRSFDSLLKGPAFAGFEKGSENEEGAFVNLGEGFGAVAGNEIIGAHMKLYDNLQFVLSNGKTNRIPIPHYTTTLLEKYGLNRKKDEVQDLGNIIIYSAEYFSPKHYESGKLEITNNTFSIHHFDASWWSEEEKYRAALRRKIGKFLPAKFSKQVAKAYAILKYRGIRTLIKETQKWVKGKNE